MLSAKKRTPLRLAALRGRMGDWIYYATCLPMKEIAERVSLVSDIHKTARLDDWIQREVDTSRHSKSIEIYLLSQKQRLFNAIVLGVYGGSPNWQEVTVDLGDREAEETERLEGSLGLLLLNGKEKLFAIDGQHRVVGIRNAFSENPQLGKEEVCALLIAHSGDAKGKQRTRRLFSTLNRYAKPVSKMENIALDEDDVVAIVTRRLVDEYPLLHSFIALRKGNSLPKTDSIHLSTVTALYDGPDMYLCNRPKKKSWELYKRMRPPDPEITPFYERATEFWDSLTAHFAELRQLAKSKPDDRIAHKFRNQNGGHLLFRPIGLTMIFRICTLLLEDGLNLSTIHKNLTKVPMQLTDEPWNGVLWDPVRKIIIADSENQRAARLLLYYGLGGNLERVKTTVKDLRETVAGIRNTSPSSISLPTWVHAPH
jgi:DNA sulfur modification protein DndB